MSSKPKYPLMNTALRYVAVIVFMQFLLLPNGNAQSSGYLNIYQSNSKESLIPPSPTAASFQRFGITPVDLHSGVPNISIPIYNIKCGDISVPVSLSYHNNGFKPQDKASWVGLGWNLGVGGCITRQQRGSPDNTRSVARNNFDSISPMDSALNTANNQHKLFLYSVYFDQKYDTEPDVFIYNFPGHQGKFVFLKGKAYFGDYEPLKVVTNAVGFTITDDNGTQYVFTDFETTRPRNKTDFNGTSDVAISAWFLTTIIAADQKHQVSFYYADHTYHQGYTLTSETYTASFAEALATYDCTTSGAGGVSSNFNSGSDNITVGKSLSMIKTSDGQTIKFLQATSSRYDIGDALPGEAPAEHALQNIVVYGQSGNPDTVISKFAFAYDYFTHSSYPTSSYYARLKLRGMYNLSATNDTLNNYAFSYNNEFDNFPGFNTHGTDAWGYYNGNPLNGDYTSLMPQIFFYTEGYNNLGIGPLLKSTNNGPPYGNKEPNANYSQYGVLNKITYPTGGYTTFQFEQNKYAFYNPDNSNLTDDQRIKLYKDTGFAMTTFNTLDDPHNYYGTSKTLQMVTFDTVTTVYLNASRTIWDSLELPIKTFNKPVYIAKILNTPSHCGDDNYTPIIPCDTSNVFSSPVAFIDSVTTRSDSVVLQAGTYIFTLYCDNKSFKTDLGVKYKIRLQSPAASGPGLRIASVLNYDGIQTTPVSQKSYYYEDSLGKPSGVLNEAPRYEPLLTEGTRFGAPAGPCAGTPMLQYVFNSDNNAVYNANMNFLFYYYGVKEYTAPTQSNTYYSEHYYRTLLMPTPPSKFAYYSGGGMPVDFGKSTVEDILLSSEPVEVKTISWLNRGGSYQKQTEINTTYGYTIDKSVTGIRPISTNDANNETSYEFMGWTFNQYTMYCLWKYPTSRKTIMYDTSGNSSITTSTFAYNAQRQQSRIEETVNNGKKIITKNKYPSDYTGIEGGTGLIGLWSLNVSSPVIETQIWQKNSSTDSSMLKGVVTDYDPVSVKPSKKYFFFNASPLSSLNNETHDEDLGGFNTLRSDTRYSEKMRMNYDKRNNVMEVLTDSNMNVPTCYVWGYYGLYPVAKVVGARFTSVVAKIDTAAIQSITDDSLLRVALAPLRTISGAQATVYTYAPFVGMTSSTDINGRTSYFEYDNFNRLLNIRDINNYVLKSYAYQYAGLNTLPTAGSNPPANATITAVNNSGLSGFTATFTNRSTNAVTTYTITTAGGTLSPMIPAGSYNISIARSGNTATSYIYSINCSSLSQTAVSASFSNVAVSSSSCNSITIASQDYNP